tara:strand:- start:482 stop:1177 length:696 start_codon:yes stop_codon:yes gene_type:complete
MAQDKTHWFKSETAWNYRRKQSEWHFDPTIKDTTGIKMNFLQFKGDWQEEILAKPFDEQAPLDLSQYLQRLSVQEHIELGVDTRVEGKRVTVDPDVHTKIFKIVETFGLSQPYAQIIRQMPGEMFTYHIDKICCAIDDRHGMTSMDNIKNDEDSIRLFVSLQDWSWGQYLLMGNYHWTQWSAGDVMWFRWQDLPHGSANCGHKPRYFLKITGKKTKAWATNLAENNKIIQI